MHEFSVCRALIDQVESLVRERGAQRALQIVVSIGPLSGVEAELLRQAYSVFSAGTCAQGARLVIEASAVRVLCLQCGAESEATASNLLCRSCGAWRTRVVAGDEMLLVSAELQRQSPSLVDADAHPPDCAGRASCVAQLTPQL